MKSWKASAVLGLLLVGALGLWASDHSQGAAHLESYHAQISSLRAANAELAGQLNELDAEKEKAQSQRSSTIDEEMKVLDERNKLSEEVDDLKQQNALLAGNVEADKTDIQSLKFELNTETKLYQDAALLSQSNLQLAKQRGDDFNRLLVDYKELCAQYNRPMDTGIQYNQLTGEAAKDLAPSGNTHTYYFQSNGMGGGSITGQ